MSSDENNKQLNTMTSEDRVYFSLFNTIDDEDLIRTWMIKSLRSSLRLYLTVDEDVDWYIITESILQYKPDMEINCFLEDFHEKIDWDIISSRYQYFSIKFVNNFHRYLNWKYVSRCQKLSSKIIRKYYQSLDWTDISRFQKLSEELIMEFQYYVNWYLISKYQLLSLTFIEKYADYVNWSLISKYQVLTPEFIEKYEDYVDWGNIEKYQNYFVE